MHPSRRRKKRPNYGIRTVEVSRGPNGFGFTISGQQPCILSCIVQNSPADQAGLRAGDFLISVNGISVSKITHDAVVSLIGNSVGAIRMTIAENYYSDSSDEDLDLGRSVNMRKPKYMHKPRMRTYKHEPRNPGERNSLDSPIKKVMKREERLKIGENSGNQDKLNISNNLPMEEEAGPIEYKAIVGYLGTIEMPKQLLPNNRLQTVCSCIRKLRQEKRSPTAVLMTVLPTCLTLKNASNHILAIYPTNRVVYISSTNDRESRYFGLVTSAFCDNRSIENVEKNDSVNWDDKKFNNLEDKADIDISNSCHVFVTDPKIVDHNLHARKAENFRVNCTADIVTGNCLEFPKSALYIVSLVQNMYKLQDGVEKKNSPMDDHLVANSPQPSASSNSDSGIGFRDDCGNISDRILVVEFPANPPLPVISNNINRPVGIDASNFPLETLDSALCLRSSQNYVLNNARGTNDLGKNNVKPSESSIQVNLNNIRACENINFNKNVIDKLDRNIHCEDYLTKQNNDQDSNLHVASRLTVRAMPSTKLAKSNLNYSWDEKTRIADVDSGNIFSERPVDVPDNSPSKKSFESVSLNSVTEDNGDFKGSMDNVSMHSSKSCELANKVNVFKTPSSKYFISKKNTKRHLKMVSSCDNLATDKYENSMLNYKLSPKVYGVTKPNYSCEELNSIDNSVDKCGYSSLQDLTLWTGETSAKRFVAQSEPDVRLQRHKKDSILDLLCEENGVPKSTNSEGAVAWSTSFEKLLDDPLGLHTFAEFLKKEFSAENIYFWTACERFRRLPSGNDRVLEAQRIYKQHLCIGAPEPVNVDSQGRQYTEQRLQDPESSNFDQAQKQIFNLMKFDSYPRFLKSDLYKQCLAGNVNGPQLDTGLLLQPPSCTPNKLKKSLSNAEDRRRKSLLPWHRKNRSKSKDRGESEYNLRRNDIVCTNNDNIMTQSTQNSGSDLHSSRSSLTSLEAMTSRDSSKFPQEEQSRTALCRVILNKEATSVVQIRPTETIQQLVNRMLEKRGLVYSAYEVFMEKHCKGLDISESAMKLAGADVIVEQRVTFKLDLPNHKIIAVKSKCTKILVDVLRPILQKYKYNLDDVLVTNRDNENVDILLPVTTVDCTRLYIRLKNEDPMKQPRHSGDKDINLLDEITNKVYEDILQEKADSAGIKQKSTSSVKSEDWGSEHSSGIFGRFLRRDSGLHERKKKNLIPISRSKGNSVHSSIEDVAGDGAIMKKPIKAKWKPGVKLQMACSENDELYEGLSRALRSRLEDQRGTEINFELPDFLKDKENDQLRNNSRKARRSEEGQLPESSRFYLSEGILPKPERVTPPISSAKNLKLELQSNYENRTIMANNNSTNINRNSFLSNQNHVKVNNLRIYSPSKHLQEENLASTTNETNSEADSNLRMDPPPLPPKPKVLPIKPSNWGQNLRAQPTLYLEQPTSSFV